MNESSINQLIQEIALKNGIAVSANDPIMILHTINNRLLEDSFKSQQALLQHHKEEMEGVALRWGNQATSKAELIVNKSLEASKTAMMEIIQEEAKKMAVVVKSEIDASLINYNKNILDARRVALFNIVASCITLLAISIGLIMTLG